MSIEENKAIVRRYQDEIWNHGNVAVIDELVSADWVSHSNLPGAPSSLAQGPDVIALYRAAFPDLHLTIDHLVGEDDLVAMHWTVTGTHREPLMGIPATGKTVTVSGMGLCRVLGHKVVEQWGVNDVLGLLRQLGVAPSLGER